MPETSRDPSDQPSQGHDPAFVERLLEHVLAECPSRLPHRTLREMVERGLVRADSHGLHTSGQRFAFVTLMFRYAPNFAEHPQIRAAFQDPHRPVDERWERIFTPAFDGAWREVAQPSFYDLMGWHPERKNLPDEPDDENAAKGMAPASDPALVPRPVPVTPPAADLAFIDPGPPCTPADVAALEATVGGRLPEDYRQYLLTHNGAQPYLLGLPDTPCIVKVGWREGQPAREGGSGRGVDSFLRLRARVERTPTLAETFADFRHRIPTGTLPIVRGDGGSLFLLWLHEGLPNAVGYWDRHYRPAREEGRPVGTENVGFVAGSFTAFLAAFQPEPDDWERWERENA